MLIRKNSSEVWFMKEKVWRVVCLGIAALSGGWLAFYGAAMYLANRFFETEAASIGVIGGADGPTAIFVATTGPDWDMVIAAALLVLGLVGYWWLKHRKPKE